MVLFVMSHAYPKFEPFWSRHGTNLGGPPTTTWLAPYLTMMPDFEVCCYVEAPVAEPIISIINFKSKKLHLPVTLACVLEERSSDAYTFFGGRIVFTASVHAVLKTDACILSFRSGHIVFPVHN